MCAFFIYGDKMNENFIEKAVKLSKKAYKNGDFPVGCVIVRNGKIISKGYNKKEKKRNAINHAEIIAISKACKKLKTWHLDDCTMYCTMEPCIMCVGAIIQSRIKKIVYCSTNENFGAVESKYNILSSKISINKIENKEYQLMIKQFFKDKRK